MISTTFVIRLRCQGNRACSSFDGGSLKSTTVSRPNMAVLNILKYQPCHNLFWGLIGTNALDFVDTTLLLLESLLDSNRALVSKKTGSICNRLLELVFIYNYRNTKCIKWSKYTKFVTSIKLFKAHDK